MFLEVFKLAPTSFIIFPFCVIASWMMKGLACLLSPLIAGISMTTGKNEVGGILAYFYTHDASLDGGIDGGFPGYDPQAKGLKLWWQRIRWICRNPAYRFNAHILGFDAATSKIIFEHGVQDWPNFNYWTVIESKGGWRFFGWRGDRDLWFGWNYIPYGGRHQLKAKPIKDKL